MRTAATRTAALIGVLVVWAAFTSVNARLGWVNPVLLPTPVDVRPGDARPPAQR